MHSLAIRLRLVALLLVSAAALSSVACGDEAEPISGDLTVTCALEEAPPVVGQNAVLVTVTFDGEPVLDAVVSIDPQMPMHGHGSTETAVVEPVGDGTYRAFPVTFQMPGYWEVTVRAESGDKSGTDLLELDVPAS